MRTAEEIKDRLAYVTKRLEEVGMVDARYQIYYTEMRVLQWFLGAPR